MVGAAIGSFNADHVILRRAPHFELSPTGLEAIHLTSRSGTNK